MIVCCGGSDCGFFFFFSPEGNRSKNELSLNLQKLLLSVTIKHNSDSNNLISLFSRLSPKAFAMRNHFTMKAPFRRIEPDLANGTTAETLVNIKCLPIKKKEKVRPPLPARRVTDWLASTCLKCRRYGCSRRTPCYNCDEAAVLGRADLDYLSSL